MSYFSNLMSALFMVKTDPVIKGFFFLCAVFSILVTVSIIGSVLFESIRFFSMVPLSDFLLGTQWSPQLAMREDQAGSSGAFGIIPLLAGTILITFIAMCVATPLGLYSAVYLSEYAPKSFSRKIKPLLEMLAGIPTVVYGYFAVTVFAPLLHDFGKFIDVPIASEGALVTGVVMGIMIMPFVMSLATDAMNAVPISLHHSSIAMGATRSETIRKVIIPAAFPGIVSAVLLGVSRGIGETMIVVMAAGLFANLTANPLEPVTTITVQIVTLLVGDQEFDSAKTLAAFALGLTLFFFTLLLNMLALYISRKYSEQYD